MASNTYNIRIGGGVNPEVFSSFRMLQGDIGMLTGGLRNLALPFTAVFSGTAIASFVSGAARAADALADLREETGLTIEALGGIKLAADIKGLGEIDLPMKKFSAAVREAQVEGTKFNELFKTMGVDPMRELDQVLFDVADKFRAWEDGINKLGIAEDLFGTKQTRFIQLLNMGSEGLRENISEFDRTHPSVNEAAKAVDDYTEALQRLKSASEGLAQSAVVKSEGFFTALLTGGRYLIDPASAPNFGDTLFGIMGRLSGGPQTAAPGSAGPAPNPGISASDEFKKRRAALDLEIEKARIATETLQLETISEEKRDFIAQSDLAVSKSLIEQKMALTMEYYDQLGESADRFRLDDMRALLDAEQKYKAHLDRKQALERAHEAELARLRQMRVQGVSDMFGNLAAATELFGKKGLIAYRVFATAQATIDTAKAAIGAYSSVVGIPYVGPVLAPIAAGAAVAAGAAQIARINGAFEIGGYTGDGGTSEVAGIVHRREFVIPANRVEEFGVPFFEAIRNGQMRPAPAAAASGSSSGSGVNVAFLNNRQDLNEWMATEGAKIAFDYHQRRAR